MSTAIEIGANIKKNRINKGLTQQELADKLDKSLSLIKKYESGSTLPPFKVMDKIAKILSVPFRDLLDNVDDISIHYSTKEDQEKINNANEENQEILDIIYNSKDINELFSLLIEKSFLSQDFTKNNIDIISDHLENPKETDYYTENFKEFVNGLSKIYKTYLDIFLTFKSSKEGE